MTTERMWLPACLVAACAASSTTPNYAPGVVQVASDYVHVKKGRERESRAGREAVLYSHTTLTVPRNSRGGGPRLFELTYL